MDKRFQPHDDESEPLSPVEPELTAQNDESPTLPTLEVERLDSEATIERLLGNARFREGASLILYIEHVAAPLMMQPPPLTVLGRLNSSAFDAGVVNLSPYEAREKGVSRLHAFLHRSQRTLAIEDVDSTNGTYVNGQRLTPREPHILRDGDEIRLGTMVIHIAFHFEASSNPK